MSNAFKLREDGTILTPKFRVSFPHVFQPSKKDGKFGCGMIFEPDTDFSGLKAAIKAAIVDKWPTKVPNGLQLPLKNGTETGRIEYEGKYIINGKCYARRPGVCGPDKQPLEAESDFYAGCYARATIKCFAWDNPTFGTRGVSIVIQNIQKLEDGEPLTGGVKAEDDFDALPAEAGTPNKADPTAMEF